MEFGFSLEPTHSAKETEEYSVFQMTLYTQETGAEEIPDLPPKPTNAEIDFQDSPALPWQDLKVKVRTRATVKSTAKPPPSN